MAFCDRYSCQNKTYSLDDEKRNEITRGVASLASKGERVLGLSELILDSEIYNINISEPIIENKYDEIDENNNDKLQLLHDINSFNDTLYLPIIRLGYLYRSKYYIISDRNSFSIHPRPLKQFRFTKFYETLFNYFDSNSSGQLNGEQIYDLFVPSQLTTDTLRTTWDESVGDNCPTMNLKQFTCAMNLILRQQIEINNFTIKHGSFNNVNGNGNGIK